MCVQAVSLFCRFIVLLFISAPVAAAENFLARPSLAFIAEQANPELLRKLIVDVEDALGVSLSNNTDQHLLEIEEALRPTFKALPRNTKGRLDHSTARYALHRLFTQQNGWVIRGFQTDGDLDAPNSSLSSTSRVLEGRVPSLVQELFEVRLGMDGWSLSDLAAYAVLLEHLVGEEIVMKLERVYKVQGVSLTSPIPPEKALAAIELYMMLYIQGHEDVTQFERAKIDKFISNFHIIYPPWPQTRELLRQILQDVGNDLEGFIFKDVVRVLREAESHYFERVHSEQCQQARNLLLEFEDKGSGRVKLVDFYNKAIYEHKYQFTETIEFLRQNGALDESDPLVPRVIIPNYVSGQANCVARSAYYAVCCPDECESRLDELELRLGKPYASPTEILEVQEKARHSGRISSVLVSRLEEIADHHEGLVPLHGRLFAQWMHFVHPQSCTYPYVTGAVYTKTMEEWEEETGLRTGSTMDEIHEWSRSLAQQELERRTTFQEGLSELDAHDMWTLEEELIFDRNLQDDGSGFARFDGGCAAKIRVLIFIAFFIGAVTFISKGVPVEHALRAVDCMGKEKKHYV